MSSWPATLVVVAELGACALCYHDGTRWHLCADHDRDRSTARHPTRALDPSPHIAAARAAIRAAPKRWERDLDEPVRESRPPEPT